MPSIEVKETYEGLQRLINTNGISFPYIEALYRLAERSIRTDNDIDYGLTLLNNARKHIETYIQDNIGVDVFFLDEHCKNNKMKSNELDLWWKILLLQSQNHVLDAYLLYIEKNRQLKDKFYQPRRKCFLKINLIQSIQDMLDDKLDVLSISLPPGTGKSTLEKFLHSAVCGWYPEDFNLFFSHSAGITRMYYDGVLDILTNNSEYTWNEIFPGLSVTSTNAKMEQINIGTYKPFPNVQTASVGSEMAGKVRASRFLFVDDMIGKIEEALNRNTLEKLWNIYSTDARQRKIDGCKEIHIATRWSVNDVIGRLQRAYEDDKRCKFIAIPDIDPDTGESNFLFDINGFSVNFYKDQELLMDEISYRCLYKNDPIEREGLLFPEDKLRRYFNMPSQTPDEITGQADCKSTGVDYMVMPVLYKFGEDYYLDDCICDDGSDFEIQYEQLSQLIVNTAMQSCEFESNQGGDRIAFEVNKRVTEKGWICNITDVPTETNKEARIFQCSNWIMQHIIFKDKSLYESKSHYGRFMSMLTTYSVTGGKKQHDDVPDVLANFALRKNASGRVAKVEAVQNPFRNVSNRGWW